jgi:uncharacterized protein
MPGISIMPTPEWLAAYFALGAVTGILAGLFGIGGGGVMVPVLTLLFAAQQFPPETLVHLALGTSMAAIVPSSLASMRSHHQRGAVNWFAMVRMAPGVLLGTFVATFISADISTQFLAVIFSGFMALVALQLFWDMKPKVTRRLPGTLGLSSVGFGIGGISALVAIGGGTMTVPFLTWCNQRLPVAIGTSAAVGLPIAVAGALGYAINGWGHSNLPIHSWGFVHWPALLCMAIMSSITAPLGANLAHRLPVKTLKKLFGILTLGLALQMLLTVF